MAEADKKTEANDPEAPRPKYKRSAKNYLLDTHFQLKYTAFLMAIAIALSSVLGALLFGASAEVLEQTRDTVEQGKKTVRQARASVEQGQKTIDRGKEGIKLSDTLNKLGVSTIQTFYPDDEGLLSSHRQSAAENDLKLQNEQKQLEADKLRLEAEEKSLEEQAATLEKEVARVESRQKTLHIGLIAVLVALVAAIGVAGIVFTHKIAGPIFKMKRLFRNVGEGKLILREKLRKGDELQHFFEAFESMVNNLGEKQKREIEQIDAVLAKFDTSGESYRSTTVEEQTDAIKKLRKLRSDMQEQITP